MTPTSDNPSPTPLHEPINAVIDATVKEEVQESSGPEARETPPRSSLLDRSTHISCGHSGFSTGEPSASACC